jgi:hypothetical protein
MTPFVLCVLLPPALMPLQEIMVPDAADAAGGLDPTAVRRWRLKKFTTVLIVGACRDKVASRLPARGATCSRWFDQQQQAQQDSNSSKPGSAGHPT